MKQVADADLETFWAYAAPDTPRRIADVARRALKAPTAVVTSFAEAGPAVRGMSGPEADQTVCGLLCREVVERGEALLLPPAPEDERLSRLLRELAASAYLGVPIRLSDGGIVGTLGVIDTMSRTWSAQDLALAEDLAALLAEQIELKQAAVSRQEEAQADTQALRVASGRDGAPQAEDAPFDPSRTRVLLADDLDLNRRLIADMLSIDGYRVDCVADGAAAVAALSQRAYDLVLMDMIMPGMDGIAATRAIRALPYPACNVPIVALTANSFADQLDSCLKAGMDATLVKPMSVDALTATVATWARGRNKAA